jgi:DNA-binding MarR family transcriptional regulator
MAISSNYENHEKLGEGLCLHLQRAARVIGRRFDESLKPMDLTNGQVSLLIALSRPEAPRISDVAAVLGMDRTTLTANLKPLERRGLIDITRDEQDKRSRRVALTETGRELLEQAAPIWRGMHEEIDAEVPGGQSQRLCEDLRWLALGDRHP